MSQIKIYASSSGEVGGYKYINLPLVILSSHPLPLSFDIDSNPWNSQSSNPPNQNAEAAMSRAS